MEIKENTVYNCDCIELMREMEKQGMVADCLLTDIPYGEVNRKMGGIKNLHYDTNADVETFDLNTYLELVDKVVGGVFLIFCGIEQVSGIKKFFADRGYSIRLLIWEKNNAVPLNAQYLYVSNIECCVYARKKGATFNAFNKGCVFKTNIVSGNVHPTQKPLELWYELLRDNTNEGQLVLDTCMGSFTTAVACHKTGRRYIGAELDKEYFDKGTERLNKVKQQITFFD